MTLLKTAEIELEAHSSYDDSWYEAKVEVEIKEERYRAFFSARTMRGCLRRTRKGLRRLNRLNRPENWKKVEKTPEIAEKVEKEPIDR